MIDTPTAAAVASVCTVLLAVINLARQELVARRVAHVRQLVIEEQRLLAQMAERDAYSRGQLAERFTPRVEPPEHIEPK